MPHLTVESIRKRKTPATRQEFADAGARGLYLVLEPSGTKRFVYAYKVNGKRHKHALGVFGDVPGQLQLHEARELAATWRSRIKAGEYPHVVVEQRRRAATEAAAERDAAPTVETLLQQFRDRYLAVNTRRPDDRLVTARKWITPALLATRVADVRRRDLNALLDTIVAAGSPVAAGALGRLLGQMFRWAVDEEWIDTSPAERLQKGSSHTERDRVLSDDEVRAVWAVLERTDLRMSTAVRVGLRILMLTGARSGELAAARWEHLDLKGKEPVWTIPATATKMARAHLVPLSPQAVEQFKTLQALTGDTDWCLPAAERVRGAERLTSRDTKAAGHLDAHAIAVALRRTIQQLTDADELAFGAFTAHDLRRTLRTGLSRLGTPAEIAEATIGHVSRNALVRTYDQYDRLPERRTALRRWGAHVAKLVTPRRRAA